EEIEIGREVRPLGASGMRHVAPAGDHGAPQAPAVVENKPRECRDPFAVHVARECLVAELQDATRRVVAAARSALPAAKTTEIAVEVPIPAADPVERKPRVAIEQTVVPDVP